MPDVQFTNLFAILLIALAAPLLLGLAPRVRVPAVVLEIALGVVVGPSVLGWVEIDLPVQVLALVGLAFLLFLGGLKIDVHRLRGRLLRVAVLGYLATLAIGAVAGTGFAAPGWVQRPLLLAVTLSATSLGLGVPVLKDAGRADSDLGQTTIAASSVADFAAVVLLSLLFSTGGGRTGGRVVLLAMFALTVVSTALAIGLAGRSMRLGEGLFAAAGHHRGDPGAGGVALLMAFVVLPENVGLESILGAFLAGAVVGALDRDTAAHPHFRIKLEAIGYGFVIPVFFVTSGVRLDLAGLVESPAVLARVPLFLLALLAARGVPALLYAPSLGLRSSAGAGLLQATSLPFIVTATQIGVATGFMEPVTASALVCAGLLSVLVLPAAALGLLLSERKEMNQTRPAAAPLGNADQ